MAKYKIKSETMTWGGTAYKVRRIPAGKGRSSDPVDVTTLDDVEERFIPGALIKNKEFQVVAQGLTEDPTINTVADVVLNIVFNDGSNDVSKTVTIPNCILKDFDPPNPEASGERAAEYTLIFQPGGSDPAPASNSGSGGSSGGSSGGGGGAARNCATDGHDYETVVTPPTCTEPGYTTYTCKRCKDQYTDNPTAALGHAFGEWSVTTAPAPVYEGEDLVGWVAGTKTRTCTRCSAAETGTILVTPVLQCEFFDENGCLPVEFFSGFEAHPPAENLTLADFGTELFWASSPSAPNNPFNRRDLEGAVVEWVNGGTLVSSLKDGDQVQIKITVPANLRDVYADTVVTIKLVTAEVFVIGGMD